MTSKYMTCYTLVIILFIGCTQRPTPPVSNNSHAEKSADSTTTNEVESLADSTVKPIEELPPTTAPGEEPQPTKPTEIKLEYSLNSTNISTTCPAYQTLIRENNNFILQMVEMGDIVLKGGRSIIPCTIDGEVTLPPGYIAVLNVDSLKFLGAGILGEGDTIDYTIDVTTVSGLQYVKRYKKTIIGPLNGPFDSLLDTYPPTNTDIPCPTESQKVPFNIKIQTVVRSSGLTNLPEVEGFLNRTPGWSFSVKPCK